MSFISITINNCPLYVNVINYVEILVIKIVDFDNEIIFIRNAFVQDKRSWKEFTR